MNQAPTILLAPMDGVIDAEMRAVFTAIGGYDRCVTEFIRVTQQKIPERVFLRLAPELQTGGKTASGTPVYPQLLGGSPRAMAFNAARLSKLAPPGIDLNFGCPSKTVNRREGGSVLLKEPQRVYDIVAAVRDKVPAEIPVTAKIRLGFDHSDDFEDIAQKVVDAGAAELCIHARTKAQAYKPPALWQELERLPIDLGIPVTINGDIWDVNAARLAMKQSGANQIMLGRGALRRPDLALQIKAAQNNPGYQAMAWPAVLSTVFHYLQNSGKQHPHFVGNRAKQWLGFLAVNYPEAKLSFQVIKTLRDADAVLHRLKNELDLAASG